MAAVTKRQLRLLSYWLEGDKPNTEGEWGMHCPFHDDKTRSASLNTERGVWYCQVCEIGGGVADLVRRLPDTNGIRGTDVASFIDLDESEVSSGLPSERRIQKWHENLGRNRQALLAFQLKRGLSEETIKRFQVGWDPMQRAYTLPIRDLDGRLVNVRFYQIDPLNERRKIWGVTDHNEPVLFPMSELEHDNLIVCEGEWDALIAIQYGFHAVTRTSSARVWKAQWNYKFVDKVVYACHDADATGQLGDQKVIASLKGHARAVYQIPLPYENDGKDLTDYFYVDEHSADDFKGLLAEAQGFERAIPVTELAAIDLNLLDSFDAGRVGERLKLRVTITGKRTPTYVLPEDVIFTCTQSAGVKCQICPMNEEGGMMRRRITAHDEVNLQIMGSTNKQVDEILREHIGAQKCNLLDIEVQEHRTAEELFVRPSVDQSNITDHTQRKVVSIGRHDTLPNNTVQMVGTIYPSPKGQWNEFQAWEVNRTETSIDKFEMTPGLRQQLRVFQAGTGGPLAKLGDINRDLAANVTRIYGRQELHLIVDLVYHSALGFMFDGRLEDRGWLEALVVGDTRTGKSEIAKRIQAHYGLGELISCESATFAGIIGGLQQLGNKEWEVTWGTVPLNDRRLVVLDEISGLSTEQISQMSSVRSSGEAQLIKIRTERTWARTRLLWLGNPRSTHMGEYTYGVHAIKPLIGNNEDIARFDIAFSVKTDEVEPEVINRERTSEGKPKYPSELCHDLVLWAWSRQPSQIHWDRDAEQEVYTQALDLGAKFIESPPLIQVANVRMKLARIAVALAIRTFSTDTTGELVLIRRVHVMDAAAFLLRLYSSPGFGYAEISKEAIEDQILANRSRDDAKRLLVNHTGLSKFLRSMVGGFRSQDLQDMLGMGREEANRLIGALWKMKMIHRVGPQIKLNGVMHDLIREVEE